MQFISFPVFNNKVDERLLRAIAMQVCLLSSVCMLASNWYIPLFLVIDFLARASGKGSNTMKYSLLRFTGEQIKSSFGSVPLYIGYKPKKFTFTLGAFFSLITLIAHLKNWKITGYFFASLIASMSGLFWITKICLGNYLYAYIYAGSSDGETLKEQANG